MMAVQKKCIISTTKPILDYIRVKYKAKIQNKFKMYLYYGVHKVHIRNFHLIVILTFCLNPTFHHRYLNPKPSPFVPPSVGSLDNPNTPSIVPHHNTRVMSYIHRNRLYALCSFIILQRLGSIRVLVW